MELLMINGSPKREKSNTIILSNAFISGMKNGIDIHTTTINLYDKNIDHCLGCYSCWRVTPGKCVLSDDVENIIHIYLKSDIVIWSTPVHTFGMSSMVKVLIDRLLPLYLPNIEERNSALGTMHPLRYDLKSKKYVLISTCGFPKIANNTEPLITIFDLLYGDTYEKIICSQGDLYNIVQLKYITSKYIDLVYYAGQEYARLGQLSQDTKKLLCKPLINMNDYILMANFDWTSKSNYSSLSEYNIQKAKNYVRQMKLVYEPGHMKAAVGVLQMEFDGGNYMCQFVMTPSDCTIIENKDCFYEFTLKITTTIDKWIKRAQKLSLLTAIESPTSTKSEFQVLTEMISKLALNGAKREMTFS